MHYNGMAVQCSYLLEPDDMYSIANSGGSTALYVGWRARIDLVYSIARQQALSAIRAYARQFNQS